MQRESVDHVLKKLPVSVFLHVGVRRVNGISDIGIIFILHDSPLHIHTISV
jgi:hypothetical protein